MSPDVPSSMRFVDKNGNPQDIPTSISSMGHVVGIDENGELVSWTNLQQMLPLKEYFGPTSAILRKRDGQIVVGADDRFETGVALI